MKRYASTIVIPAYNEEAVILRTLRVLVDGMLPGEFEVIVVCNGCSDSTAQLVRSHFAEVRVIEIKQASKTHAQNTGIATANADAVLLLDADIELTSAAARALLGAVRRPGVEAAIGHMDIDLAGASSWVRAFYRIWLEHPYLTNGKFAAAIALSPSALMRIGTIPGVTADDTYLRRVIPAERVVALSDVRFLVRVPRKLGTLIRVRTRVYRGTSQLAKHVPLSKSDRVAEARGLMQRVTQKPELWIYLPLYLAVNVAAKCMGALSKTNDWQRDLTTRPARSEGTG